MKAPRIPPSRANPSSQNTRGPPRTTWAITRTLRVQADLTEQGGVLSGDYINLRLILDGTEQSTALDGLEITDAGLVDDTQHADQTQPVAAATLPSSLKP